LLAWMHRKRLKLRYTGQRLIRCSEWTYEAKNILIKLA
jgi:hypothetical protein